MGSRRAFYASAIVIAIAAGCSTSYSVAPDDDGGIGADAASDTSPASAVDGSRITDGSTAKDDASFDGASACGANLQSDTKNCGSCGHICNTAGACVKGECEHVAFVVAGTNGNLSGLMGADKRCRDAAAAAGLHNNFLAWLGTSAASPATRFFKAQRPYVLVGGQVVAASYAALTGANATPLMHGISADAMGVATTTNKALSEVAADGTTLGTNTCVDWTSTMGSAGFGSPNSTNGTWTNEANDSCANNNNGFYCFEQ